MSFQKMDRKSFKTLLSLAVIISATSGCALKFGFIPTSQSNQNSTFAFVSTEINMFETDSGALEIKKIAGSVQECKWKKMAKRSLDFKEEWIEIYGDAFFERNKPLIDSGKQLELACVNSDVMNIEFMCYTVCSDGANKYGCYSSQWTGVAKDRNNNKYKVVMQQ